VERAIVRVTAAVEGFMCQRGVPVGTAQDIALEGAFITYRAIAKGSLVLPLDAEGYDQKITAYMRTVAWRLRRNHKRAGDIFVRHDRELSTEVIVSRTYDAEPALELASEIAVKPPRAPLPARDARHRRAFAAAAAAGMTWDAGKWTMRRVRAKRLAAAV